MYSKLLVIILSAFFCLASVSARANTVINFEDLSDLDTVGSHYQGVTFTNAVVLTAGASLNEFDFPPHSGINAIFDQSGLITISFQDAVSSISGYFTHTLPLSMEAYDSNNQLLGSTNSFFLNNTALNGDAGSSPNELMSLSFSNLGISKVIILGESAGSSFVADDFTFTTTSAVPLPQSYVLLISGLMVIGAMTRRRLS